MTQKIPGVIFFSQRGYRLKSTEGKETFNDAQRSQMKLLQGSSPHGISWG
jgi:hypothetical protein